MLKCRFSRQGRYPTRRQDPCQATSLHLQKRQNCRRYSSASQHEPSHYDGVAMLACVVSFVSPSYRSSDDHALCASLHILSQLRSRVKSRAVTIRLPAHPVPRPGAPRAPSYRRGIPKRCHHPSGLQIIAHSVNPVKFRSPPRCRTLAPNVPVRAHERRLYHTPAGAVKSATSTFSGPLAGSAFEQVRPGVYCIRPPQARR